MNEMVFNGENLLKVKDFLEEHGYIIKNVLNLGKVIKITASNGFFNPPKSYRLIKNCMVRINDNNVLEIGVRKSKNVIKGYQQIIHDTENNIKFLTNLKDSTNLLVTASTSEGKHPPLLSTPLDKEKMTKIKEFVTNLLIVEKSELLGDLSKFREHQKVFDEFMKKLHIERLD
jgi:hypothetical protein